VKAVAFTDGGCRPKNPGHAGMAVVIRLSENGVGVTAVHSISRYLGIRTNNYAEYVAVITAIKYAKELGADELLIMTDSKLVMNQIQGNWRVLHAPLKPLRDDARKLLGKLFPAAWDIQWHRRNHNVEADALCTLAINYGRNQNPFTPQKIKDTRPGRIQDPFDSSSGSVSGTSSAGSR
jgi:ribonuclease HI